MDRIVKDFFERQEGNDIQQEVLENGIRYLSKKSAQFNRLHEWFKPLSDEQIDGLQEEVNAAQMASFVFPAWYRDFFRTANGCNLFYGCISLYGDQTPTVWSESEKRYIKATLPRSNPDWMAPFDLRFTNSVKFEKASKQRWLTIGSYAYDGTQIVWDFKTEKIEAMYRIPVTLPLKAKRALKEADYERMICAQWDNFDAFFAQETERLGQVVSKYGVDEEKGFLHPEKTLPIGHREYQE